MSSPRRLTKSRSQSRGSEPFPSMPAGSPQSGPSNQQDNSLSTTTSVTTTTVVDGRNDPVTTTSTQFPQVNGAPANPPTNVTRPGEQAPTPYSRTTVTIPSVPRQRPISIRRLPSASNTQIQATSGNGVNRPGSGRRRSASDPQARLNVGGGGSQRQPGLSTLREEPRAGQQGNMLQVPGQGERLDRSQTAAGAGTGRRRSISNTARSIGSRFSNEGGEPRTDYEDGIVDYLDVIGMMCLSYHPSRS